LHLDLGYELDGVFLDLMLTLLGPGGAGEAKVAEPHLPDMALFQVHTREIGEKDAENSIP